MRFKVHPALAVCSCLASLALALAPAPGSAQEPCPAVVSPLMAQAWQAWRADSVDLARERFARALDRCPALPDARAGLGFTSLRQGLAAQALAAFDSAIALDSLHADGWAGRALALQRLGHPDEAVVAARRTLSLAPGYASARDLLDQLEPDWNRPPRAVRARPDTLGLQVRTRGQRFEIWREGRWEPFLVRGVNLGVALPGRFPAEFPTDSALYAGWLDTLSVMGANTVRLYTILPPAFYRALRAHNLAPAQRPLHLLHGVWTELPPGGDFADAEWLAAFRTAMEQVVDVVHGGIDILPRPGHASGRYDADVSSWTLGYVLGREWEPFAVAAWDARGALAPWAGRYLVADSATPMERWLAAQADHMLAHEVRRWHALRPVAFTNWPTLDPLHHPTESNADEEAHWRARAGRPLATTRREYENDRVSLDPGRIRPTAANPAGWFAAYHAYPYYPDFLLHDPGLAAAAAERGTSNYAAYLADLVAHHAGLPVLVAEVGLPSSRGLAHWQPQGLTHGGLDEHAQAAGTVQLVREVEASGAAGTVLFAWLDEWFKHNWVTIDLELPAEHNPRWLNVEDAEQQYGILGLYAGTAATRPVPGGEPARWRALPVLVRGEGAVRTLHAGHDEAYVYLAAELSPEAAADPGVGVAFALDVVRPDLGQARLPGGVQSEVGFEFLADLRDTTAAALLVLPEYNPYAGREVIEQGDERGRFHRRPVRPVRRADARWDSLLVIVNRARYGRGGEFFPARTWNRGTLRYGRAEASSLADWFVDREARLVMLRLPWALLNVTDPSTHQVAFEFAREGPFGTVTSDGFRIGVLALRGGQRVGALPAAPAGRWRAGALPAWRWPGWTVPRYHQALKPVYSALRALWSES